jgi:hypothetical protein
MRKQNPVLFIFVFTEHLYPVNPGDMDETGI